MSRLDRQIRELGQNSGISMVFFSNFGQSENTVSIPMDDTLSLLKNKAGIPGSFGNPEPSIPFLGEKFG